MSFRRTLLVLRSFCAIAAAIAPSISQATDADLVQAGRQVAQKYCARCHSLATGSAAKPAYKRARPMSVIAKADNFNAAELKNFLQSTGQGVHHPGAMRNPELTDIQIQQVSAFLTSLARTK